MNNVSKFLLIVLGTLCVILAVVGIFVPVLPTTPFLLLAAALYARSSQGFYKWLMNNRFFGAYIRNYREGKGVTLKHKIFTLSLLWLTIGYSALFLITLWWVRLFLLGIAMGVSFHLLKIKTYQPED